MNYFTLTVIYLKKKKYTKIKRKKSYSHLLLCWMLKSSHSDTVTAYHTQTIFSTHKLMYLLSAQNFNRLFEMCTVIINNMKKNMAIKWMTESVERANIGRRCEKCVCVRFLLLLLSLFLSYMPLRMTLWVPRFLQHWHDSYSHFVPVIFISSFPQNKI